MISSAPMSDAERALRLFCNYYGFDHGLLSGHDRYAVETSDPDFDGRVHAIRLTETGRFGNIFYQILHAVLLARHLRVDTVELFPFAAGPPEGCYEIAGLKFICDRDHKGESPTLVGHFFNSYPFQSALSGFAPDLVVEIVDTILRPLFAHLDPPGVQRRNMLTMNFRGGDTFSANPVHEWYVQPPANYYLMSALFARSRLGVEQVMIVSEDRSNPALAVTEAALLEAGFGVKVQNGALTEDIGTMLSARHLVSPYGTLCEAIAMLSTRLETYFAFRQFESHRHLHAMRPALLTSILKAHGVRPVRISDPARDYIPPLSWRRTGAQIQMMREFPLERLEQCDLTVCPDQTDDFFLAAPTSGLPPPRVEAYHLRSAIVSLRTDLKSHLDSITQLIDSITKLTAQRDEYLQHLNRINASGWWRLGKQLETLIRAPAALFATRKAEPRASGVSPIEKRGSGRPEEAAKLPSNPDP